MWNTAWEQCQTPPENSLALGKVPVLSAAELLQKSPTPSLAAPFHSSAVAKADPATFAASDGGKSPVSKMEVECFEIKN